MEIINGKKIKESLAKGFMLLTLTGALTAKNPVATNNGNTVVYAAETLESKQTKALKNLEKVYKYYSKSYYTTKEYKKLTNAYNKGVKAIKACKDKTSIQNTYEEYKEKLNAIKPSILVKYQKKMEKSLLKSYKSLVSKNEYSDYNLSKLEEFKEEGIEKIYASKNKSKAKKNKTAYVKKMKSVTTLLDQTRAYMVNYINNNKDLTENEKTTIIEEINNAKNVDAIVAIGEEYGYEEVVDETITVDQINAKIKELCKKYPKYTEDEIRSLVATTNMDYVDENDIYTIFNVNSKEELKNKVEQADQLIKDAANTVSAEYSTRFLGEDYYKSGMKDYKDIIWANDLIMVKTLKVHGDYMCDILKTYVEENCTVEELEELGRKAATLEATKKLYQFVIWFYDDYDSSYELAPHHCYDNTKVININDERLQGSTGYILNKFIYSAFDNNMLDWRANQYALEKENRQGYVTFDLENELAKNNYIYEKIDSLSKKIKTR